MARPTARVLALLELLQAGGIRTVRDLSERLAVDERTVRRYIEHLRELDIPVDAVRGRYGGYRLARHYRMPPLMLTEEEALAVVWALLLHLHSDSGPATRLAVQTATAKVRRVLPGPLARRIDAVLDTVDFTVTQSSRDQVDEDNAGSGERGAQLLLNLAEAARDRHPVTFTYRTHQGRTAIRQVYPHGVVAHRGLLYLTGLDTDRQASRTFRLDRVTGLRVGEGTFETSGGIDPVAQVLGPLGAIPWRHEVSLLVRSDIAHVRTKIPETLASVTALPADHGDGPGWVRVFLRAERLEWVAGTLAMLDRPFVIERPEALRAVTSALGHRLIEASTAAPELS